MHLTVLLLCLNGDIRQFLEPEVGIRRFLRQTLGFQLNTRPAFKFRKQLINPQPQRFRWQKRAHRINAAILKA